uniref:FMN hydroxy acid dehydrogenase domain-containing protein n=1 Tax=Romanomermis culicivorax TaxID=13658 RepID=A0A915K5B0_ROMCU
IDVLSEIVKAVDKKCDIYLDGGIRSGNSVFKALAMGAKAVFVGRPILYGLANDGAKGVERILEILDDELRRTMSLAGFRTLEELHRADYDVVRRSV